jgi:hypothetical protein
MLYMRYIHLTKCQAYLWERSPHSIHRGCYIRTMISKVHLTKNSLVVSLKGLDAKTNWLVVNCQS